jgi:hypothetical protein
MSLVEKIITGLTLWIMTVVAVGLTVVIYAALTNSGGAKIDCTTHNINPDSTASQKAVCRNGK